MRRTMSVVHLGNSLEEVLNAKEMAQDHLLSELARRDLAALSATNRQGRTVTRGVNRGQPSLGQVTPEPGMHIVDACFSGGLVYILQSDSVRGRLEDHTSHVVVTVFDMREGRRVSVHFVHEGIHSNLSIIPVSTGALIGVNTQQLDVRTPPGQTQRLEQAFQPHVYAVTTAGTRDARGTAVGDAMLARRLKAHVHWKGASTFVLDDGVVLDEDGGRVGRLPAELPARHLRSMWRTPTGYIAHFGGGRFETRTPEEYAPESVEISYTFNGTTYMTLKDRVCALDVNMENPVDMKEKVNDVMENGEIIAPVDWRRGQPPLMTLLIGSGTRTLELGEYNVSKYMGHRIVFAAKTWNLPMIGRINATTGDLIAECELASYDWANSTRDTTVSFAVLEFGSDVPVVAKTFEVPMRVMSIGRMVGTDGAAAWFVDSGMVYALDS